MEGEKKIIMKKRKFWELILLRKSETEFVFYRYIYTVYRYTMQIMKKVDLKVQ